LTSSDALPSRKQLFDDLLEERRCALHIMLTQLPQLLRLQQSIFHLLQNGVLFRILTFVTQSRHGSISEIKMKLTYDPFIIMKISG